MKKFGIALAWIPAFVLTALSQSAVPTPTPTPPDAGDVVRITTTLIQLDVTVTDGKGRVITDLKPDEIEVYENGKRQAITNFSFVSNRRSIDQRSTNDNKPIVALPPGAIRPEQIRRSIALVVDDLTLSFQSTYQVRRALRKFVDEQMEEGDLVAIIRAGSGIGALQQFTTDKRLLRAAVERIRWNAAGVGKIGAFTPVERTPVEGEQDPEFGGRIEQGIESEFEEIRESVFAAGTLGAIHYVVRGMQDLPGRKSILLLSDGFKLFSTDSGGAVSGTSRAYQGARSLIDFANRSSVVIYTMDARGLQFTGLAAVDDPAVFEGDVRRISAQVQAAESTRRDELHDNQAGLQFLARQTGGIAITNSNDLSGGIRKVLDDQSYYLVGYEPDGEAFDPVKRRFNQIEIKVTRPDTRVRYRSGFFGVSDEKLITLRPLGSARLATALISPFATNEIALRLNTIFTKAPDGTPFVRSLVHINGQDLKFTDEPDGKKKVVFDVQAAGFGDNGMLLEQISKTYTVVMARDAYARMMKQGFVYDFSFTPKMPGAYQMRVALRDHGSDKIGSASQFIEFPNLKKGRLMLSGVVLENIEYKEWERRNAGGSPRSDLSDPLISTSLRQFKAGSVLNYGFSIYNAKHNPAPNLSYQSRLYRDGKPVFESPVQPVIPAGQPFGGTVNFTGSLALGSGMPPGDYVLQVVIIDNLAKAKQRTVHQFAQFDIIE